MAEDKPDWLLSKIQMVLFVVFIIFIIAQWIETYNEKETYRYDVDRQFQRMHEYRIKPLEGKKRERTMGNYWAEVEYGILTEEEKNSLISDIKNDGFIDPYVGEKREGRTFCRDKIDIYIHEEEESEWVRVHIGKNDNKK